MKKEYGKGSSTNTYYVVEARLNYDTPKEYKGMILDKEWRRVQFQKSANGIINSALDPKAHEIGLLGYDTAMALAYGFMAAPLLESLCVQTRLVSVKFTYQYSCEEVGVGPVMDIYNTQRETEFVERV